MAGALGPGGVGEGRKAQSPIHHPQSLRVREMLRGRIGRSEIFGRDPSDFAGRRCLLGSMIVQKFRDALGRNVRFLEINGRLTERKF